MSVLKKMKKILITIVMASIVFSMGFISGCGIIQGFASDIEVVSGAINRGLEPMEQSRKQAKLDRAAQLVIDNKSSK